MARRRAEAPGRCKQQGSRGPRSGAPLQPGVGRGALPDETSQNIELARNLRRQPPDDLELQGAHPQRVEKLVLVDSYGLGGEVPWGRLGYLLARAPLLDELA